MFAWVRDKFVCLLRLIEGDADETAPMGKRKRARAGEEADGNPFTREKSSERVEKDSRWDVLREVIEKNHRVLCRERSRLAG